MDKENKGMRLVAMIEKKIVMNMKLLTFCRT